MGSLQEPPTESTATNLCDPRVQRSREAILAATRELMAEVGFAGTSIDAISKRSGVARTTIYRHWNSLGPLVYEAAITATPVVDPPETEQVWDDVTAFLSDLARRLRTSEWSRIFPALIDAASRDDEMRAMQKQHSSNRRAVLTHTIERGQRDGAIRADVDAAFLSELLAGPLFNRAFINHLPVSQEFVDQLVATVRGFAAVE